MSDEWRTQSGTVADQVIVELTVGRGTPYEHTSGRYAGPSLHPVRPRPVGGCAVPLESERCQQALIGSTDQIRIDKRLDRSPISTYYSRSLCLKCPIPEVNTMSEITREGSLEAPTRHPLDWNSLLFYDQADLNKELERVFDICHGCRRCVSLCQAFPTLFDLVDESDTMEVDGVSKADYWKVVDHCYLCDLCYLTKCPYVPPHEWNLGYPSLQGLLRAQHRCDRQNKK